MQGGTKGWNVGISLSPGISYALTDKFHLEMGFHNLAFLGYGRAKSESISSAGTATSTSSNFGFHTNLGTSSPLNIGFRILLQKNRDEEKE